MIKFFRKARMKLLSENKFKKYIGYAIGEIVLVVIGILIALQINTWNNENIEHQRNRKLLQKLSTELEYNIKRTDLLNHGDPPDRIGGYSRRIINADSILTILEKGINKNNIDFLVATEIYWYNDFNLNKSAFEQMKNTGILYSIGSDSLITEIQLYYQLLERESLYNLTYGKDVIRLRDKTSNGWANFKYMYMQNPVETMKYHKWVFNPRSEHNVNYRFYVYATRLNSNLMKSKLEQIKIDSKKLKDTIAKELSSKK